MRVKEYFEIVEEDKELECEFDVVLEGGCTNCGKHHQKNVAGGSELHERFGHDQVRTSHVSRRIKLRW